MHARRHLPKNFDNVHNLEFRKDEAGNPTKAAIGMYSGEPPPSLGCSAETTTHESPAFLRRWNIAMLMSTPAGLAGSIHNSRSSLHPTHVQVLHRQSHQHLARAGEKAWLCRRGRVRAVRSGLQLRRPGGGVAAERGRRDARRAVR